MTRLQARLEGFVGKGFGKPRSSFPVNEAMIGHWCLAMADRNPVYTDPGYAERSRFGGIVAPPTMLQVWTMPQPDIEHLDEVIGKPDPGPNPFALLDEAGFTGVVATNSEQEYARYLRPGDRVTMSRIVEAVSEEKRTALGPGHFVTVLCTYTDHEGEVVGRERFRMLKFKPADRAASPSRQDVPGRPRPISGLDTAFFWEGVGRGELPIQRCASCGTLRHPPRPMCGECRSLHWDTVEASGRGTLHAFVIPRHPPLPQFGDPCIVALVDLEEGVRILSNLRDVDPSEVRVGMAVELFFDEVEPGLTLPQFRAAG